jgi:uncharacterized protein (DUF305 family)
MPKTGNPRAVATTGMTAVVAAALFLSPVRAEPGAAQDHSQHGAAQPAATAELSEASKAFEAAMQKMHSGMTVPYTNDVDVDFVRGMVPHHQGAIDQAEILLKYSKNLRLKRLAGGIIAAQRREIRFMQNWLKEHDKGVETSTVPSWMKDNPTTVEDAKDLGAKD